MITTLFSESLSYALGWTVIHSLWQSTLLALLIGVLIAIFKPPSALSRYRLYYFGIVATFLWAIVTFFRVYDLHTSTLETTSILSGNRFVAQSESAVAADTSFNLGAFISYFDTHLPMIITLWLLGMSFFMLRFLGGLAYSEHLRSSRVYPVAGQFVEKLQQLRQQLGMSRVVHLLESAQVKAPMTLGTFKPIILMPIGALTLLSPTQLEAILAHELAHIRRNDYFFNILQSMVEVLFYYNPAIWWLSAQVRMERENCCDDIAVKLCGDDLAYAKALLSLQEYSKAAPGLALAFSNKRNHLLNRVKRILNHPINRNNIMEKFSITSLILLCLLVFSVKEYSERQEDYPLEQEVLAETMPTFMFEEINVTGIRPKTNVNTWTRQPEIKTFTLDTLPQGKVNISTTRNGEKIEAKLRGGKIKELKINGVVQPESAYDAYLPIFEEIVIDPPAPPAPPAITPMVAPSPPGAPAPPVAPTIKVKGKVSVKTTDDDEGNTILLISTDDGREPMEVKVKGDQDEKVVIINGEVMETDSEFIVVDENQIVLDVAPGQFKGKLGEWKDLEGNSFIWVDSVSNSFARFNYSVLDEKAYAEKLRALEEALAKGKITQAEMAEKQAELAEKQQALIELKGEIHEMDLAKALEGQIVNEEVKAELQKSLAKVQDQLALEQELKLRVVEMELAHQEEVLEEVKEMAENELEAAKASVEVLRERNEEAKKALIEGLYNDGILSSKERYAIILTEKSLKVDGKKQSPAVFQKYWKLYQEKIGKTINSKYKMTLKSSNF